jgi:hypothetical protein
MQYLPVLLKSIWRAGINHLLPWPELPDEEPDDLLPPLLLPEDLLPPLLLPEDLYDEEELPEDLYDEEELPPEGLEYELPELLDLEGLDDR